MPQNKFDVRKNNFLRFDEKNARKTSVLVRAHTRAVCNRIKREVFRRIFPSKKQTDFGQGFNKKSP